MAGRGSVQACGEAGVSESGPCFEPLQAIVEGGASDDCRACVTIPARDESESLPRCLDAIARQVDLDGAALGPETYEVLLLLNNCTDLSPSVVCDWRKRHPYMVLHVVECTLRSEEAHVGTARRLLMDTAWKRLSQHPHRGYERAILSTDADSVVASDWIAQNLRALQQGADVVGGCVNILPQELRTLPKTVRRCYQQDRLYAQLTAQLEHLLDPQECDPWPRHLDHFGSSLACTPRAYATAGGMPSVSTLEDEAFIDRARRANLRLRHDHKVQVYTSARLHGRAKVGLAGQLRLWSQMECQKAHFVPSAAFLEYRFRTLRQMRQIFKARDVGSFHLSTEWWVNTFREALERETTCAGFLGAVYCNVLIEETFQGERVEPIEEALAGLRERVEVTKTAMESCNADCASSRMTGAQDTYVVSAPSNSVQ